MDFGEADAVLVHSPPVVLSVHTEVRTDSEGYCVGHATGWWRHFQTALCRRGGLLSNQGHVGAVMWPMLDLQGSSWQEAPHCIVCSECALMLLSQGCAVQTWQDLLQLHLHLPLTH